MKNNQFKLNSLIDDVTKDLAKAEKEQLKKASAIFKKELRTHIRSLGLVDSGNLLKGIKDDVYSHAVLVGMSAPAFHALIVEFGTVERSTLGKGSERSGIRSTGTMPASPYFRPASQVAIPKIQKELSENWL